MTRSHPRQRDLDAIIEDCRQESARFRAGQPGQEGHCFELFRRAIEEGDEGAWTAIHNQYYLLVGKWIGGHERGDELISRAFEKLWRSLRNANLSRRFKHVGAVLAYLRKCACSVRLDLERQQQRRAREVSLDEGIAPRSDPLDDVALSHVISEAQRATVRRWLEERSLDAQERLVIATSYELDLSPAETARRYPQHFPDARAVRRVKERVLKRLRRQAGDLAKRLEIGST